MVRGHRDDIDGLRAVAILPVLFFHANIWPFAGGYVGVDVFFVISGYLITGLILRERQGAGFSFVDFYDRRIRRILPALTVVLAAASVAALFILLPDEIVSFGNNLAGAELFCANIVYWLRDSAYFAPAAGENPLLHVWSLSVEEQFYLFWPLLLIYLARFRRALPWTIVCLALASLAMWQVFERVNEAVAFYLLPARAWQLLVGAYLAAGGLRAPRRPALRNAVAVLGVATILAATIMRDSVGILGLNALGAAVGTAAVLFAAEGGENIVSAILATRLPVFIGRISYSLYLWHWPLLVFARLYLNRELTLAEATAILIAAVAISTLSWKYVEQPIRMGRFPRRRGLPLSFPAAAAAGGVLLTVAALFVATDGLPGRVPADVRAVDAVAGAPLQGKWCDPLRALPDICIRGDRRARDEVVLWGDSHARALAPGLDGFVAVRHWRLREYTKSSCPPLPPLAGQGRHAKDRRCAPFNRAALKAILGGGHVRLVILEGRWEAQFNAEGRDPQWTPAALERSVDGVLASLTRRGIAVLLVGNVPAFSFVPAHCYGRDLLFGRDPSACTVLPPSAALAQIGPSDAALARAAARYPAVRTFFPSTVLCDGAGCHAFSAGHVLYRDDHHLSDFGADLVGRALDAASQGWPG